MARRMKSTEVYRVARGVLAPWCKAHGFRRTTGGLLGWHKPLGELHLVFWLQCSQDGWDAYAGSKFIVEFQLSRSPQLGAAGPEGLRERLPRFLAEHELELVREIQNTVIRSLPQPQPDHLVFKMDQQIVDWYLSEFKEVAGPYRATDDVWLRYWTPEDVKHWAEFLLGVLPRIVQLLTGIAEDKSRQGPGVKLRTE
jgi:hypothetical protein